MKKTGKQSAKRISFNHRNRRGYLLTLDAFEYVEIR